MKGTSKEASIKSKKRVKDYGEVFTPEWIVKDMCDLIPKEIWDDITRTFLEPSCGTGNFLVEIFARKLSLCNTITDGLTALQSIYGIDIQEDNVEESKKRLMAMFIEKFPYNPDYALEYIHARAILEKNIVVGNSLEPQTVPWLYEAIKENE